jgi:hypothetical protein
MLGGGEIGKIMLATSKYCSFLDACDYLAKQPRSSCLNALDESRMALLYTATIHSASCYVFLVLFQLYLRNPSESLINTLFTWANFFL